MNQLMTASIAFDVDRATSHPEWDQWVASTAGGHHVQTSDWARVKARAGLSATRVTLRSDGELVGGCQMLVRKLPVGGSVAYMPRGPLLASHEPDLLDEILAAVRIVARKERIVYLKIQPPVDRGDLSSALRSRGMVPSDLHTAPAASVRVDVGPDRDEDGLLKAMRKTTRRRIRQAERNGVEVRSGGEKDLPILQSLLEATAKRQGFAPYPAAYYRCLWECFAARGQARLLIAEHEGVPLSAAMIMPFGETVLYKIGAWGGDRESVPGGNELMHWTAIRWAHSAGYRYYDFDGIPIDVVRAAIDGEQITSAHGVAYFKLGFGGEPVLYPGTYDSTYGFLVGPALAHLIPHAERWHTIVHHLSGRKRLEG